MMTRGIITAKTFLRDTISKETITIETSARLKFRSFMKRKRDKTDRTKNPNGDLLRVVGEGTQLMV